MHVIVICIIINIWTWLTPRLAIIIGNDTRRGTSPSCVSVVSSFILMISFPSSEVVRHVSQHELGTTFSRSGLFCNTTTTHLSKLCCIITQTNTISLQQRTIFIYGQSDNATGTSEHILIWSINHITTVFQLHKENVIQTRWDTPFITIMTLQFTVEQFSRMMDRMKRNCRVPHMITWFNPIWSSWFNALQSPDLTPYSHLI